MNAENPSTKTCSFTPCGRVTYGHGLCRDHYRQQWRGQELSILRADLPKCAEGGCTVKPPSGYGPLCSYHQKRAESSRRKPKAPRPERTPCSFPGCINGGYKGGALCYWHFTQERRGGVLFPVGYHGRNPETCSERGCRNRTLPGSVICRTHADLEGESPEGSGRDLIPCPIPECPSVRRGNKVLCQTHNSRARKYGLSPRELRELLKGGCALCGSFSRLAVDHDHACCYRNGSCGHCVRGALCGNCNNMLGHGRNAETLRRGAEYLEHHATLRS